MKHTNAYMYLNIVAKGSHARRLLHAMHSTKQTDTWYCVLVYIVVKQEQMSLQISICILRLHLKCIKKHVKSKLYSQ